MVCDHSNYFDIITFVIQNVQYPFNLCYKRN